MSQKHVLTILHCVLALVLIPAGLWWARSVYEQDPLAGLVLSVGAVVLPVLVVTRVAWASGYEAGVRSVERVGRGAPEVDR
jgi:hypothetical protein